MAGETVDQWRQRFTIGGHLGGDLTTEVHSGTLLVKQGEVVKDYPPRCRLSIGPGIGPHWTDDPDVLRTLGAQLEAAAAMLELRQARHAAAKEAACR